MLVGAREAEKPVAPVSQATGDTPGPGPSKSNHAHNSDKQAANPQGPVFVKHGLITAFENIDQYAVLLFITHINLSKRRIQIF
jgi:hypothetical protein